VPGTQKIQAAVPGDQPTLGDMLPSSLSDAMEVLCAMRGIGFQFGKDVHVPLHDKPLHRKAFLWATTLSFVENVLLVDLQESLLKLVPGVGTPDGGTIFLPHLPPLYRYLLSTLLSVCLGSAILASLQAGYDFCTLFAVGLLRQSPLAWPPMMGDPWKADSVSTLWSKEWHQILLRTFLVFGGIPGQLIAGNLGMVLGVFLASGLYHEATIYTVGKGFDIRIVLFFLLQAVAVILERAWKKMTGKRVGGIAGTLWKYAIILSTGQIAGRVLRDCRVCHGLSMLLLQLIHGHVEVLLRVSSSRPHSVRQRPCYYQPSEYSSRVYQSVTPYNSKRLQMPSPTTRGGPKRNRTVPSFRPNIAISSSLY
jgi:hypothetical protein